MSVKMPQLQDVFAAARRIEPLVWETPLWSSPALADKAGAATVSLKLECLQNTGAFKVRGASNKILGLTDEEKKRGVITFSTGNHGKAVSFVAGQTGIKAVVCLSEHVPAYRAEGIRALGGHVEVKGDSQDEAEEHYRMLVEQEGYVPVVPFDDPAIIAGQGTIALEMLRRRPDMDTLLVPLSGGGLLAGIAMAAKAIKPGIRVVGVSIEQSPAMLESLKAGKPVGIPEKETLADSLLGGIGKENHWTLPLISNFVDEHITVNEKEVEQGMVYAFLHHSLVIEGAAAVGIGALLNRKVEVAGRNLGLVLSGSTIDPVKYRDVLDKHIQ